MAAAMVTSMERNMSVKGAKALLYLVEKCSHCFSTTPATESGCLPRKAPILLTLASADMM